jgi:hypothetical protein
VSQPRFEAPFVFGWKPSADVSHFGCPSPDLTVADWLACITDDNFVGQLVPDLRALEQIRRSVTDSLSTGNRVGAARRSLEHVRLALWHPDSTSVLGASDSDVVFLCGPPPDFGTLSVLVSYYPASDTNPWMLGVSNTVRLAYEEIAAGRWAYEWVVTEHGPEVVRSLRELRTELAAVADQSLTTAVETLRHDATSSRRTLTAFGVSVQEPLVALAGPTFVLAMCLLMLARIGSLRDRIAEQGHLQTAITWVGTSDDPLSRFLLVASVFLLPAAACGMIVYREGVSGAARSSVAWWGGALGVAVLLTSARTVTVVLAMQGQRSRSGAGARDSSD